MSNINYLLSESVRPSWLTYPRSFCRIVDQSLVNLDPWHVYSANDGLARYHQLQTQFPNRELFPFAYRSDNDDLACWSIGQGEKVFLIQGFSPAGWEGNVTFENVWKWFVSAVEDTMFWES